MSEDNLTIRDLRKELGLTLAELAERIGINSVGHMSDIERGTPCSVKVALAIEELSNGRIRAGSINADVAAIEARFVAARDNAMIGACVDGVAGTGAAAVPV